jgi:hypothetical protein
MTFMVDDLKQYQTQNWWRKCAIYLQKTATWQRVNVNKTFMQSFCTSSHTSQVNSHDRIPTKIFESGWWWRTRLLSVLQFESKLKGCQFDIQKNVVAELNMVTEQVFYKCLPQFIWTIANVHTFPWGMLLGIWLTNILPYAFILLLHFSLILSCPP